MYVKTYVVDSRKELFTDPESYHRTSLLAPPSCSRQIVLTPKQYGSEVYQHDVRLCHLVDVNSVGLACSYTDYLKLERPSGTTLQRCLDATEISDQQVWDIATRWSGLRDFQALYQLLRFKSSTQRLQSGILVPEFRRSLAQTLL